MDQQPSLDQQSYELLDEFLVQQNHHQGLNTNSQQQRQGPSIEVHKDHVMRHAKELQNATHGRYAEGWITPPPNCPKDCVVQLSTEPASESTQPLQPNLLHVTIMNGSERKAAFKSTLTPDHWRIRIRLRAGKGAFLMLPDGQEKAVDCLRDDGRIELGSSSCSGGGLLLTIITPLQDGKRGGPEGVRIVDVIKKRMEEQPQPPHNYDGTAVGAWGSEAAAQAITEQYISKKKNPLAKIEMHRCRLRVEYLSVDGFNKPLAPAVLSSDIFNSKQNDVGALDLHDMSDPRSSCTKGGFKVLLSLEFKAPTLKKPSSASAPPIQAVFVLKRNNGSCVMADSVYSGFRQISLTKDNFQIHHNTLAFMVPEQDPQVIRAMGRSGDGSVRVALYRPHDQRFSATTFEFEYKEHHDECPYCAIRRPSELRKYSRARKDHRRRVTEPPNDGGGGGGNSPNSNSNGQTNVGGGGSGVGDMVNFETIGNGSGSGGSVQYMYNYSDSGYSPASSSNYNDETMGSPPAAKFRRVSNAASGSSSNDEMDFPQVEHLQDQQQQHQFVAGGDGFILDNFIETVAAVEMSPNNALSPHRNTTGSGNDLSSIGSKGEGSMRGYTPPPFPSSTHSPIPNSTEQQQLGMILGNVNSFDDLMGSTMFTDLLATDSASCSKDRSSDFMCTEVPSKELVESLVKGSKVQTLDADMHQDGDGGGGFTLEVPPMELIQALSEDSKPEDVGQCVLSAQMNGLNLDGGEREEEKSKPVIEEKIWLQWLGIGMLAVIFYEITCLSMTYL